MLTAESTLHSLIRIAEIYDEKIVDLLHAKKPASTPARTFRPELTVHTGDPDE